MSCADKSTSTGISALVPLRTSLDGLAALCRCCRHALELWRQRRALCDLDDHLLADIGVTREEALREAKKLFWTRI